MDASTSTSEPPADDPMVAAAPINVPVEAIQETHVNIHIDLDTEAGMAQARALLSGLFASGAQLPPQEAPVNQQALSNQQDPINQQAPQMQQQPQPQMQQQLQAQLLANLQPQAQAPVQAQLQAQLPNLLQQFMQNNTPSPRRRVGRPTRAETELRNLLSAALPQAMLPQAVQPQAMQQPQAMPQPQVVPQPQAMQQPQAAAPQQQRPPCRLCNQLRADSVLRSCRHFVCRVCILPFIQLRPVCPVSGCGRPTTINDIVSFN